MPTEMSFGSICAWLASSCMDNRELTALALRLSLILVTLSTDMLKFFALFTLSLGAVELTIMLLLSFENSCGSLNALGWYKIARYLYPNS